MRGAKFALTKSISFNATHKCASEAFYEEKRRSFFIKKIKVSKRKLAGNTFDLCVCDP